MKKTYIEYFNLLAKNVFHASGVTLPKEFQSAIIRFDNVFSDGVITADKMLDHPLVSVHGLKTEGKLFGYSVNPHPSLKFRSLGGTSFTAAVVENIELPGDVSEVFSGKNFSIFTDDKEQAVAAVSNVPKIVDVNG
jgi:hypothetical protein